MLKECAARRRQVIREELKVTEAGEIRRCVQKRQRRVNTRERERGMELMWSGWPYKFGSVASHALSTRRKQTEAPSSPLLAGSRCRRESTRPVVEQISTGPVHRSILFAFPPRRQPATSKQFFYNTPPIPPIHPPARVPQFQPSDDLFSLPPPRLLSTMPFHMHVESGLVWCGVGVVALHSFFVGGMRLPASRGQSERSRIKSRSRDYPSTRELLGGSILDEA